MDMWTIQDTFRQWQEGEENNKTPNYVPLKLWMNSKKDILGIYNDFFFLQKKQIKF